MTKHITTSDAKPFRKFLGKIDGFVDKQEKNLQKAHLKAYIGGHEFFHYGYSGGQRCKYKVQQQYL